MMTVSTPALRDQCRGRRRDFWPGWGRPGRFLSLRRRFGRWEGCCSCPDRAGYETRPGPREERSPILQIRDPNGNWLEVQAAPTATAILSPASSEAAEDSALLQKKQYSG